MLKKLGLEGWFSAHFAYGIVQIVFVPMMVPSFILLVLAVQPMLA